LGQPTRKDSIISNATAGFEKRPLNQSGSHPKALACGDGRRGQTAESG
jgi:hypothetical protein